MSNIAFIIEDTFFKFDDIRSMEIENDSLTIDLKDGASHIFCSDHYLDQSYRKLMLVRAFLYPELCEGALMGFKKTRAILLDSKM